MLPVVWCDTPNICNWKSAVGSAAGVDCGNDGLVRSQPKVPRALRCVTRKPALSPGFPGWGRAFTGTLKTGAWRFSITRSSTAVSRETIVRSERRHSVRRRGAGRRSAFPLQDHRYFRGSNRPVVFPHEQAISTLGQLNVIGSAIRGCLVEGNRIGAIGSDLKLSLPNIAEGTPTIQAAE